MSAVSGVFGCTGIVSERRLPVRGRGSTTARCRGGNVWISATNARTRCCPAALVSRNVERVVESNILVESRLFCMISTAGGSASACRVRAAHPSSARITSAYRLDAATGGDFGESAVRATIAPETNSATALANNNAEARGDFMKRSSQCRKPRLTVHHTFA
jgi:hypothetical protein